MREEANERAARRIRPENVNMRPESFMYYYYYYHYHHHHRGSSGADGGE
jgi:hypothetical protein